MAKRKPADKTQDNSAKPTRKPRVKKPAKLPEPFTAEELADSYQALPAAVLEPMPLPEILPGDKAYFESLGVPGQLIPTTDANSIQGAPNTDNHSDNLLGPSEFIPKKKHQVGLGWFPGMDPEKRLRLLKHFEEHGNFGNLLSEHQTPGKTEPSEPTQFPSSALRTPEGETRSQPRNIDANPSVTWEANTQVEDSPESGKEQNTTQLDSDTSQGVTGDDSLAVAGTVAAYGVNTLESLPSARARDGETKGQCRERLRQEARTAGMTRRDAISYAGRMVEQVWIAPTIPDPEPAVEAPLEPEPAQPEPAAPTIVDKLDEPGAPTTVDKPPADQGVRGLGDMPPDWPQLPANASLQVEIAWVSANRLRVRSGHGVDLSRALSPAPSYSALSWLETSILFPSKFADVQTSKLVAGQQDDEKEHVRREKMAIEEIRGLLAEMLEE